MIKLIAAAIINLSVFVIMAFVFYGYRKDQDGNISKENLKFSLVFFTTLSNLLNALLCLFTAAVEIILLAKGENDLPLYALLLKYIGTSAVTVTLFTVLVFLGPTQGYPKMFAGSAIFVHLILPVLSIGSFILLETSYRISFAECLLGILPMLFYGIYYLRQVVFKGKENGGWDDFYGFNMNGMWKLSFSAMVVGTFILCVLLRLAHNAMVL